MNPPALPLPSELSQAFTVVLDALHPFSFEARRRVLRAVEAAITDAESEARVMRMGESILPSIHPDKWTVAPKLPPLPPPPSDEPPVKPKSQQRKPKRHTRRNTK